MIKIEDSLLILSACFTRFRSVQPKENSVNLYRLSSLSSTELNISSSSDYYISVGNDLIRLWKLLFSKVTAEITPIVVSTASSGIPSPVQTAPVVV